MAARTIPAFAPRSVAKAATRVSHSKLTVLPANSHPAPQLVTPLENQPAPFAPAESLGAMRGLAAVMVAYLVIAAVAVGGMLAWHMLR
ncbi:MULTISPECIES: hypothetical protein [Acidobacterium]|uniref:Conserved domain protein n=1 Tax=Acidobacterium capsulatum (strain ATCC 51196 / DSM 11244 / BCRC 80197 / JCM 7670 / NBRC 15755 / NCIMB 13165 / 161) TaxID=240015 RepID=C1F9V7_ACIC5|nr:MULTISPECIES: hypothetical protein [Acidobacterium]ACO32458.1 conserved domain protein [Acidobacterium capsulatum ATCC 51196]HCT61700.1 hypothetical protein [Acidobacterium sp.]